MVHDNASEFAGAEVMIASLRGALETRGHTVRVLAGNRHLSASRLSDFEFRAFADSSPLRALYYLYNPHACRRLREVLRTFRPQVVHLHNVQHASLAALLPLRRYPTLLSAHDYTVIDPTGLDRIPALAPYRDAVAGYFSRGISARFFWEKLRFALFRRLAANINLVVACSEHLKRVLEESQLFGPVISLPNGVAQLGRTVPPAQPRLLFVGRLEPIKGLDQLLCALPAILARQPQARLMVVGDGSQRPELEQLAGALGVRQHVTFAGHVPRSEVATYYRESSMLVMPGIWPEPFGLVGVEAMSAGRPVVASHAGGTAEWLQDGRDGFLVERRQPGQIADRVLRLLASRDLLLRMSRAAAHRAAEFSLEAYAAAMERIYEGLCQAGAEAAGRAAGRPSPTGFDALARMP